MRKGILATLGAWLRFRVWFGLKWAIPASRHTILWGPYPCTHRLVSSTSGGEQDEMLACQHCQQLVALEDAEWTPWRQWLLWAVRWCNPLRRRLYWYWYNGSIWQRVHPALRLYGYLQRRWGLGHVHIYNR